MVLRCRFPGRVGLRRVPGRGRYLGAIAGIARLLLHQGSPRPLVSDVNDQERKLLYTGRTHTVGGRDGGHAKSSDGALEVGFSTPGSHGTGTNPEQLLAAGWSACFIGAMGIAARKMRVTLPSDTAIDAEVDLRQGDDGYSLAARLNITLPGLERDVAQALADAGHETCPYSKALKDSIDVTIRVV
jgi:lipoyl-dependent peroxiredoxin